MKESILIVDDDKSTCRSLSLILNKKGYETGTARTGQEALERMQERFFNVALLDIMLPDMGGGEATSVFEENAPGHDSAHGHRLCFSGNSGAGIERGGICLHYQAL